jgi:hypothetical protein
MNLCIKKLGFFRVIIFETGLIRYSAIILLHFLMKSYDCEYMLEVQNFFQGYSIKNPYIDRKPNFYAFIDTKIPLQ